MCILGSDENLISVGDDRRRSNDHRSRILHPVGGRAITVSVELRLDTLSGLERGGRQIS